MGDWTAAQAPVTPLSIVAYGPFGPQAEISMVAGTSASTSARTWVANLVAYIPMRIPFPYPVRRVSWINGSTNTATNVDFGIYSWEGTLTYNTGSTVMGTVSAVQYVTADFVLDAGRYYFAWTCNNTTSRGNASAGTANAGRLAGLLEETTGVFGLPASMTPVSWARAWGVSCCGITRTTTGF